MKTMTKLLSASLITLGVSCSEASIPTSEEVMTITQKVADWQIKTFNEQGRYRALPAKELRKKWHHRDRYNDLEWIPAAFYSGLSHLAKIDYNKKYTDFLMNMGDKYKWKLYDRVYHADDHAVGHFYMDMYDRYLFGPMLNPTKKQFTEIMTGEKKDAYHWNWCDALYMAPPVWTRLAKVTRDKSYLEYMDKQYHKTYDELWDKEEHLFFRDAKYLTQKENNGEKIFWARGNGWVYGGLALMLPDMPNDWMGKEFYVNLFKEMSQTLKEIQRPDGTWSAGLLGDISDYKAIETSGTAFFTFGLAWGINNGILPKNEFEPVLLKAWKTLSAAVNEEGMLGFVQGVGAAPGASYENYTELYGSGAFITAGAEMYKYINKFYPKENLASKASYTFQTNGGWCWYQDPRVIINNGKLIVGGIDGISGNVRASIFDLETKKLDGEVDLHKNFQRDDHDAPVFYVREDGSLLSMWAKHGDDKIHRIKIADKDNYLKWSDLIEFRHEYNDNRGVTYMNLYYVKNQNLLYNFFRDGLNFNPSFITSKDNGFTWENRTHFISNDIRGRQRPYARYNQIDENTVGVSYTDGHPRQYGNSLYYVEFKDGAYYKVDGTKIKDIKDGVLGTSEGEKLYKGSESYDKPKGCESVPNSAWSCATGKDSKGHPHLGYTLYLSNNDHRYRIVSWDGEKWNDREIAYAGTCLYTRESSYTGLMAFDPEDPTNVYISTDVDPTTGESTGGVHEIYGAKIEATDDISTIKWKAITKNSTLRNIRPIVVAKDGYKVLLWLHGAWDTYTHYSVNAVGEILQSPI